MDAGRWKVEGGRLNEGAVLALPLRVPSCCPCPCVILCVRSVREVVLRLAWTWRSCGHHATPYHTFIDYVFAPRPATRTTHYTLASSDETTMYAYPQLCNCMHAYLFVKMWLLMCAVMVLM